MKYQINTQYCNGLMSLAYHRYPNGRISMELYGPHGPEMKITTNLVDVELGDRQAFIKNYGENFGIIPELVRLGIIEETGIQVRTGYVDVDLVNIIDPNYKH